jgi:hypothetical protein
MAVEQLEEAVTSAQPVPTDDSAPAANPGDERPNETLVKRHLVNLRARREAERRLEAEGRPAFVFPAFDTLRERLLLPVTTVPWRIHGWMPSGARVVLAAQFKSGKTSLILNLVRSLLDGEPWLGKERVTPVDGVVVLIDTEMAPLQLDAWYRNQAISNDDRFIPVLLRGKVSGFNILDARVRGEWAAHFRAVRAEVLILDCLRPVLDALALDEQRDAGRFLVAFDALLNDAGINEAVIVHHMGHSGERARGDSRLRDWPDAELRIMRNSVDPRAPRFIAAFGRDVDIPESELGFDDATKRMWLTGVGSRASADADRALTAVIEVLRRAEYSSRNALEKAVRAATEDKVPRDAIRDAILLGIRRGRIVTEPGKQKSLVHRISPTGSEAATAVVPAECAECAEVRDETPAQQVSECASASIDARAHTTDGAANGKEEGPRTQSATDEPNPKEDDDEPVNPQ